MCADRLAPDPQRPQDPNPSPAGRVEIGSGLYMDPTLTRCGWYLMRRIQGSISTCVARLSLSEGSALASGAGAAVAEGQVIVPREPTPEMIEAGDDLIPVARGTESYRMSGQATPEAIYRAMLHAAPPQAAAVAGSDATSSVQSIEPEPDGVDVAAVLKQWPDARSCKYGPGGLWPDGVWAILTGIGDTLIALDRGHTAAEAWKEAAILARTQPDPPADSPGSAGRETASYPRSTRRCPDSSIADHLTYLEAACRECPDDPVRAIMLDAVLSIRADLDAAGEVDFGELVEDLLGAQVRYDTFVKNSKRDPADYGGAIAFAQGKLLGAIAALRADRGTRRDGVGVPAELRRLSEAATPGPWAREAHRPFGRKPRVLGQGLRYVTDVGNAEADPNDIERRIADADLIATAVNDLRARLTDETGRA